MLLSQDVFHRAVTGFSNFDLSSSNLFLFSSNLTVKFSNFLPPIGLNIRISASPIRETEILIESNRTFRSISNLLLTRFNFVDSTKRLAEPSWGILLIPLSHHYLRHRPHPDRHHRRYLKRRLL